MKRSSNHNHYTLVTGASGGIGKALATECAMLGHNLFLVALPESGLPGLAWQLKKDHGVDVKYLCLDLREADAPQKVYQYSIDHDIPVDFLVNNAGIGHAGAIEEHTMEEIDEMIMLNIRTLTGLTRLFIPELKKRSKAHILNMSSFGAFLPGAHKSVYLASKSYVYYFSESLRSELNGGPVRVSTLMPGPVYTNEHVRKRINNNGFLGRATAMESDEVARYAIRKAVSGHHTIITGSMNRTLYFVLGLLPYMILMSMMKRIFTGKGR